MCYWLLTKYYLGELKMENSNDYENITKYDEKYNELWNLIIDNNIATDAELSLISYILY